MAIKKVNPYLMFDGTAEKAVRHYEKVLGGSIKTLQRYKDLRNHPGTKADDDRVIHAALSIADDLVMVSDTQPGQTVDVGGNVAIALDFDDLEDMKTRFAALAAGGAIVVALHDTFWGATFGVVKDAFGVDWMFNCTKATA